MVAALKKLRVGLHVGNERTALRYISPESLALFGAKISKIKLYKIVQAQLVRVQILFKRDHWFEHYRVND